MKFLENLNEVEEDKAPLWKRAPMHLVNFFSACVTPVVPGMFKGVFVGAATVVLGCIVAILFVGTTGFFLGNYFVEFLVWLQGTIDPFAMAAHGCFLLFIIMTGMHSVFGSVMTQSIATLGYEGFLRPTQFVHNVAEGGTCFVVAAIVDRVTFLWKKSMIMFFHQNY